MHLTLYLLTFCQSTISSVFSLHSCIRRKLVGKVNDVIDTLTDSLPETINKFEDIEFSLNKKGRWSLPDQIRDNIIHGHFQDEDYGVQLVEEHRLLKKANCVSFTSNFGNVRHTSKEKGRKRARRGRKHRGYFQISSILNAKPADTGKRRRKNAGKVENNDTNEISEEASDKFSLPEVRYEISYPSPITSSITHNPKYIDPCYSENARSKRRAKQMKTRSKFADFIEDSLEIFDDDIYENMYYSDEDDYPAEYEDLPAQIEEVTLQEILFHANKAQMLVMSSGKRRSSNENNELCNAYKDLSRRMTGDEFDNMVDSAEKRVSSKKLAKGLNYSTTLEPVTVIIPSDNVDEWTLKQKFGNRLLECDCFPRKFVINITNDVTKLACLKSIRSTKADLTFACLVFVHDADNEINNPKEEIYKVYLNMPFTVKMDKVKIQTIFDYAFTNIDEIIEQTIFFVETLPYEAFKKQKVSIMPTKSASSSNLEECANWKSQSYRLDNKVLIKMCFQTKDRHEDRDAGEQSAGFEHLSKMDIFEAEPKDVSSPKDKFCSICFEAIGESLSGTALMACSHWFCDPCWKAHLLTRIGDGKTRLVCPEYDCKKDIDNGTLLSLADANHVLKYFRFTHDLEIERQSETKWCPKPNCGAILKVSSPQVKTASCQCGTKVCFECLGEAHWPAPCRAIEGYHRKISGYGDDNLMPARHIPHFVVRGKCCPSCKRFIEKDGGCPCMSCPCGEMFCWGCGRKWYGKSHGDYCYKVGYSNVHGTVAKSIQPEDYLISKIRSSGRADWYKTAVEHRIQRHNVKIRNMKGPMKNLAFSLQRYVQCTEKRNESVSFDFDLPGIVYLNEANKTRDFLQNMLDLYSELHRIAEHVPIYLEMVYPDKEVPAVDKITSRMTALTVSICNTLQYGANDNPKEVLENLKEIRNHARNCITGLLKFINPDKTSRVC